MFFNVNHLSTHHCLVKFHKARLSMVVHDDHASNHAAEAPCCPVLQAASSHRAVLGRTNRRQRESKRFADGVPDFPFNDPRSADLVLTGHYC